MLSFCQWRPSVHWEFHKKGPRARTSRLNIGRLSLFVSFFSIFLRSIIVRPICWIWQLGSNCAFRCCIPRGPETVPPKVHEDSTKEHTGRRAGATEHGESLFVQLDAGEVPGNHCRDEAKVEDVVEDVSMLVGLLFFRPCHEPILPRHRTLVLASTPDTTAALQLPMHASVCQGHSPLQPQCIDSYDSTMRSM